jgi:hypothetical protein
MPCNMFGLIPFISLNFPFVFSTKIRKNKTRWNAPHCSQTQGISWGPTWPSPWSSPLRWISHMAGAPSSLANLDGEEKWNWGMGVTTWLTWWWGYDTLKWLLRYTWLKKQCSKPQKKNIKNRHVNTLVSDRPMWLFMRNIGMRQRFKSIRDVASHGCWFPICEKNGLTNTGIGVWSRINKLRAHNQHEECCRVHQNWDFLNKSYIFGFDYSGKTTRNQPNCMS